MTLEELEVFVTTQANVAMEAYYWWCTALMIAIHVRSEEHTSEL